MRRYDVCKEAPWLSGWDTDDTKGYQIEICTGSKYYLWLCMLCSLSKALYSHLLLWPEHNREVLVVDIITILVCLGCALGQLQMVLGEAKWLRQFSSYRNNNRQQCFGISDKGSIQMLTIITYHYCNSITQNNDLEHLLFKIWGKNADHVNKMYLFLLKMQHTVHSHISIKVHPSFTRHMPFE